MAILIDNLYTEQFAARIVHSGLLPGEARRKYLQNTTLKARYRHGGKKLTDKPHAVPKGGGPNVPLGARRYRSLGVGDRNGQFVRATLHKTSGALCRQVHKR